MDIKVLALRMQFWWGMPPVPAVIVAVVDGEEILFHIIGEFLGCPAKTP